MNKLFKALFADIRGRKFQMGTIKFFITVAINLALRDKHLSVLHLYQYQIAARLRQRTVDLPIAQI